MSLPWPWRASSTALDRISKAACAQPSSPSEPKMTAGRRRTRSSSLSWRILSLPLVCGVFCHTRSLGAPLLRLSHIDSQGSIARPLGDSIQHEIHRTIVRNLVEQRLLGQNRLGSVRVSLKAAECVLLRLRLDTLSKTCRADCWIESNIGTSVSFYGPQACVCESLWPIRNAVGSLFGPWVTSPAPRFVIRS